MGRNRPKRTHVKNKQYKKARATARRAKDLDQIQDEIKAAAANPFKKAAVVDIDLPGAGQFYCLACARYFMTEKILLEHNATRPHKRKVKLAMEQPYSQREAEAAAGMAPPVKSA